MGFYTEEDSRCRVSPVRTRQERRMEHLQDCHRDGKRQAQSVWNARHLRNGKKFRGFKLLWLYQPSDSSDHDSPELESGLVARYLVPSQLYDLKSLAESSTDAELLLYNLRILLELYLLEFGVVAYEVELASCDIYRKLKARYSELDSHASSRIARQTLLTVQAARYGVLQVPEWMLLQ